MTNFAVDTVRDDAEFQEWLDGLVAAFRSESAAARVWRHRERLAIVGWHLLNYPEHEAIGRLSQRFREFEFHGVAGDCARYHETCFVFWIIIVRRFLRLQAVPGPQYRQLQLLLSKLGDKELLPLDYYSEWRWQSCKARYQWIAPDKRTIGETVF